MNCLLAGLMPLLILTTVIGFSSSVVNITDTWRFSPPSPDPAGITYIESSDTLLISDSEVNETPIFTGDNLFEMTLEGNLVETKTTISFSREPTGVTVNPDDQHLFLTDDRHDEIFEIDPGADGQYDTADDTVYSFDTESFGSRDPEDLAFDLWTRVLFVVDGNRSEIHRISSGTNAVFDGVLPPGDDQVTSFDVGGLGISEPEGIAFNSDNGHLYIVGRPNLTMLELTTDGLLVGTIDISEAAAIAPRAVAYAPASSGSGGMNIYIADGGVDNDIDPNENDGRVFEMTLPSLTPGNLRPQVSAGPDLAVTFPQTITLDSTVSDDGLPSPPGELTAVWSMVSGPRAVTFANVNEADTVVSFSLPGSYLLRLTVSDGELSASDDASILLEWPYHTYLSSVFRSN